VRLVNRGHDSIVIECNCVTNGNEIFTNTGKPDNVMSGVTNDGVEYSDAFHNGNAIVIIWLHKLTVIPVPKYCNDGKIRDDIPVTEVNVMPPVQFTNRDANVNDGVRKPTFWK
jgi:hypothetical protein